MTIGVHGSSIKETTDPSYTELTGTWLRDNTNFESAGTLERTECFVVSVNGTRSKENTDTSGTDMDYMALYVPIAPIAPHATAMSFLGRRRLRPRMCPRMRCRVLALGSAL